MTFIKIRFSEVTCKPLEDSWALVLNITRVWILIEKWFGLFCYSTQSRVWIFQI